MPIRALSIKIRFDKYVRRTSECWYWTGALLKSGYGYFSLNGKSEYAHRASYKIHVGPIPEGLFVCHHCDNKRCVNPKHLFIGTHQDNMDDMATKGRRAYGDKVASKGEENPRAKLTERQVIRIRQLKGKIPSREIGRIFGVSKTMVLYIWSGKTWRNTR